VHSTSAQANSAQQKVHSYSCIPATSAELQSQSYRATVLQTMAHRGSLSGCLSLLSLCGLLSLLRHVSSAHIGAAHNLAARHVAARHVATQRGIPQRRLQGWGRGSEPEASDDVTYRFADVDDDSFSERHSESLSHIPSHSHSHSDSYSDSDKYSDSYSDSDKGRPPLIAISRDQPMPNYGRMGLQKTTDTDRDAGAERGLTVPPRAELRAGKRTRAAGGAAGRGPWYRS